MHILFVAGWYPYEGNEHFGVFIKEHAEAVQDYVNLSVVHLRVQKSYRHFPWYIDIKEHPRDGYTEYEVILYLAIRRFGFHDKMVKRAYESVIRRIEQTKPIDLVHLNVRMHLTKLLPKVASVQKLPIVLTEHFTYYHTGINTLPPNEREVEKQDIRKWFQNPQLKKVMPVSKQLADVLQQEYNVDENKIEIIGNVANPAFHYIEQDRPHETINTVLAANWAGNKNPLLFLRALSQLPEDKRQQLHIDWIGDGDQMPEIRAYIAGELPDLNVTFHGFQSKSFIASKLQQADFLTHPTNAENLPCIIIESLCCGTPVISNAVNGVPELIDESNGVLVPPGDIEAFRQNLIYMMENSNAFPKREIANRAWQLYSKESIGKKIHNIYKEVLKNR